MDHSCTADVISDIGSRVKNVIEGERNRADTAEAKQVADVQAKIEELKAKGFLKRQVYEAANSADFKRIFAKRS